MVRSIQSVCTGLTKWCQQLDQKIQVMHMLRYWSSLNFDRSALISLWPWIDLLGRPIPNIGISLYHMFRDPIYCVSWDMNLGPVTQQYWSDLVISIDRSLTNDHDLLGWPINDIGIFLYQILYPNLLYFLRYERWASLSASIWFEDQHWSAFDLWPLRSTNI